jgi:hypothetical protein
MLSIMPLPSSCQRAKSGGNIFTRISIARGKPARMRCGSTLRSETDHTRYAAAAAMASRWRARLPKSGGRRHAVGWSAAVLTL